MSNSEIAAECFKEGFNCSQAVLSAYCEKFGMDRETAYRISQAFGSGMGCAGTCGAVTGGLMVIGLKYGRTRADDMAAKEMTNQVSKLFREKFAERNGSIMCPDLLECDISTPEGVKYARDNNLFTTLCPKYVRSAADLLDDLL